MDISKKINNFRGDYYFLSNFYMAPVTYDGIIYTNNEAAFQAQKCENKADRAVFATLNPSEAKKRGRHVALRKDWEDVKLRIMHEILRAKFSQNPALRIKLLATGDAYLEEGNTWGDHNWGTVDGNGKNWLGHLLMNVREEQRKEKELIVLERKTGYYSGYEIRDDNMLAQVFNTLSNDLFIEMKYYTDKGYCVTCLDVSCEDELLDSRYTI